MPAQHNLNVPPYNDDWDPKKNFYRVMYKPGFPVQARELNQSQFILQDQIEQLASRFMADGDNIVPGEFALSNPVAYVRASTITNGATAKEFIGYHLFGVTSGVKAKVIHATEINDDDDVTFYVVYEDSGSTSEYSRFLEQETLESDTPELYTAKVGVSGVSKPISSDAVGEGTLFNVSEGAYYVNGFIVRNEPQVITLDKYGVRPNFQIGFVVTEEFVTSAEDPSLLDNSQGYSNFAAPGADRLKITLKLEKMEFDAIDPNFITLCHVQNGSILGKVDKTVKWDWLYDILAKRTFDESGNYIVTDFPIQPLEYYNNETVDGVWDADELGEYPPVPFSSSDVNLSFDAAESLYAIRVDPGLAYVQGYECGYSHPFYVYGNKPRSLNFIDNTYTQITEGYNITLTNVYGVPSFQNISEGSATEAFDTLVLYRNFTDGFVGQSKFDPNNPASVPVNYGGQPLITIHIVADDEIGDLNGFNGMADTNVIYNQGNSCVLTGVDPSFYKREDPIGNAKVLITNVVNPRPAGVMKPRYMIPKQYVDAQDGYYAVNSTHKLGFLSSVYYTELALTEDDVYNTGNNWEVGSLVFGVESQAFGTVEPGSDNKLLLVSNIIGQFMNGEEIQQTISGGGVIKKAKLLRPNEIVDLQFYTEGDLQSDNSVIVTAIGASTTLVKGTDYDYNTLNNGLKLTKEGREKLLDFPYPQGSALNDRVNYELRGATSGALGYAVLPPAKITNTLSKTKSVYSTLQTQSFDKFSADISVQNNVDAEVFDLADKSLFTGVAGENFITCDNFSGDASDELIANDVVTFVDDTGKSISALVLFATKPLGYGEERTKCTIYLTTAIPNNVTGKTVQRIRVRSRGSEGQNLLYRMPVDVVSTLQTDPENTRINYRVYRQYVSEVVGGATTVTLTTSKDNERFVTDPSKVNICIIRDKSGSGSDEFLGRSMAVTSVTVDQDDNRRAEFALSGAFPYGCVIKVLAQIQVTDAHAKLKNYKTITIEVDPSESLNALTTVDSIPANNLHSLGIADVRKIVNIGLGAPVGEPDAIDVTDNYYLDDGQRDNYYDVSRIYLKPGRPVANDKLFVQVEYFEHSEDGDFFSVDSYTHEKGVRYGEIPTYIPGKFNSLQMRQTPLNEIPLRDVVDFRPIVNTLDPDPSLIATINDGVSAFDATNFRDYSNGGNAFAPRLPVPFSEFQCDISYHLPRIDSLFIDTTGALILIEGNPSVDPKPPIDLSNAIRLYNLELPAYTFSVGDIKTKKFNYRRYTMADIGVIDRKVANLTQVVTLSILEQSALNMNVRDAVTGLDRFKNGIVVDNFSNHSRGDTGSSDYRNSIDPKNSHLRAPHFTDQIQLEERNQTDNQRAGDKYRNNADILTVPYESVKFVENPFATTSINLQPYSVFVYTGNLLLIPEVDTFQDVNTLPALVIEDNSLFDAMVNLTSEMADAGMGTVWGDWETTATSVTSQTRVNNQGNARVSVTETTTSVSEMREQTQSLINVSTGSIKQTSYGERVVDVQLAKTMRSVPVFLNASRLKPNTRYYAFFDNVDVSAWVSIDEMSNEYSDGLNRYVSPANTLRKGFGHELLTDDVGNLSGVFIVPNGRPPVAGTQFNGNMNEIEYQTSGSTRSFVTGQRVLRLTSSSSNSLDEQRLEAYAEATFVSAGVISDKQETIVSTRLPEFSHSTVVTDTQSRTLTSTGISDVRVDVRFPPPPPAPRDDDPIAQTFIVDSTHTEGVFVTELDAYFETKDNVQSCEAYIVTTEGSVPTRTIVPHSRVVKNPDTILRVKCELPAGAASSHLKSGFTVVGSTSGATGVIKSDSIFESPAANAQRNVQNYVYNLILSNYLGEFIAGEEITSPDLIGVSALPTFTIVEDEYEIIRVDLQDLGTKYDDTTTIEFSEPELPGGRTATAVCKVAHITDVEGQDGQVYEIEITDPGSGYVKVPLVTIVGAGGNATAVVRTRKGRPGVTMGVAISEDATAPTTFRFEAPVYLLGNTEYAFVLRSPNSLQYRAFTSRLGDNIIGTETRVSQQPSMGSLFKSQTGGLWTEDQTQDIKFTLRRAEFEVNTSASIHLNNAPITKLRLQLNPIETNSNSGVNGSGTFGNDPRVLRVYQYTHGLNADDYVAISGVVGEGGGDTLGGIPIDEINTLHQIVAVDMNQFYIKSTTPASSTVKAGGNNVYCTYGRPYEVINIYSGLMSFGSSLIGCTNRAAQCVSLATDFVDYMGNEFKYNYQNHYTLDDVVPVKLMESLYYTKPMQIGNYLNESKYRDSLHLQGEKSVETIIRMSTINSKVSPVIDMQRTNMTIVRNLINNPDPLSETYGATTRIINFRDAVDVTAGDLVEVGGRSVRVEGVDPDKKSVMVRCSPNQNVRRTSELVGSLASNRIESVVTRVSEDFTPETKIDGSVFAKWTSKLFVFENECDGLEVKLSAIFYNNDDIKMYYRPRNIGFDADITSIPWVPFNPNGVLINEERRVTEDNVVVGPADPDYDQTLPLFKTPGLPNDVDLINPRSSDNVDPNIIRSDEWQSLTWSVQDLAKFDAVAIKIVMTTDNPAQAPLIDDMQLVASE